jgi:hypothetical protein
LRGGHLNLGKWRRDESNPAGTSVAQIEATYAHLFGEHLQGGVGGVRRRAEVTERTSARLETEASESLAA